MPALYEIQSAFGDSVLLDDDSRFAAQIVEDGCTAAERLRIYRNSCRSVLTEVLRMTYRAVDRLIGGDFFELAAEQFCAAHPPDSGYLNEYGGEVADLLA